MIRQREFFGRNRHRVALLAVLGTLSLAVVLEHSGLEHPQVGEADITEAASMCLAIVGAGAVLIGAVAVFRAARRPLVPRELALGPVVLLAAAAREAPPPRSGPPLLQVFRC